MSLPPLTAEQMVKPRAFELRMSFIYAAGFLSGGIHLPYLPLWLEANGLGPEQIAVILGAPIFLRGFTTSLITAFADRAKDRANVMVVMAGGSLIVSLGYFLDHSYLTVLIVSLLLAIFMTPHATVTDSLALSGVRRFRSNYTSMRIWGSIAYFCANFVGGLVLAAAGVGSVPIMISLTFVAWLAATLFAPRLGPPRKAMPMPDVSLRKTDDALFEPRLLLLVIAAGLIVGSHGFLYAFSSIYWKSIGLSSPMIGALWTSAVVAEVGMFLVFNRVFGRRSVGMMLAVSAATSIVRWCLYPLVLPLGLGTIGFFLAQSLHAFTVGLMLISLQKLIAESIAEEKTGRAQAVAYFANGMAMAAVTLISGPLYQRFEQNGFYAMAGVSAIALGMVLYSRRYPHSAGKGG
ncbi:MFS transporter [Corticibacterium sp. UT-5YL-CI-8]|nr:MFS transporter [Tianweitania sp. UT-5YL-CI-8]